MILALVMVNAIGIHGINASPSFPGGTHTESYLRDILKNKEYTLRLEDDCDLVLLKEDWVIWSSDTHRSSKICVLAFQPDANLVIYRNQIIPEWASGMNRKEGSYILALTEGDNLAIHDPRIWQTKTGEFDGGDFINHKVKQGSGMANDDDGAFVVISGHDREKVIKCA